MRRLEEMEPEEQRRFLRKFKHPIGARAMLGRRLIPAAAIPRLGAAIEKRARKALNRAQTQERARGRQLKP